MYAYSYFYTKNEYTYQQAGLILWWWYGYNKSNKK